MLKSAFKKRLQQWAVIAAMILLTVFALPGSAFAYTTDAYEVSVTAREDNSYEFSETISVNFSNLQHGIFRYIPTKGSDNLTALKVDQINVAGWNYEDYFENKNKVIKIGDPDYYLTGKQIFSLNYRVRIYDDKDTNGDMVYLDLLPTNWETPIDHVKIAFQFPKDIKEDDIRIYGDKYGADNLADTIDWRYDAETRTVQIEGRDLPQGMGITLYCPLPEGYWTDQLSNDWAKPVSIILGIFFPLLLCALWFFFGRDPKVIPTVEFYPPGGLNPAEVGFVLDGMTDQRDLISLIVYFADKGYLSIHQLEEDVLDLRKIREIDQDEKLFAKTFFNGLFSTGEQVRLDQLDEAFGEAYITAWGQLADLYKGKNRQMDKISQIIKWCGVFVIAATVIAVFGLGALYVHNYERMVLAVPTVLLVISSQLLLILKETKKYVLKFKSRLTLTVIGVILGLAASILSGIYLAVTMKSVLAAAGFGALLFLAILAIGHMSRRTKQSVRLLGRILGLKTFIQAAEMDRINQLAEDDPSYFYHVLPYAYVMGLSDTWMKHFETIPIAYPDWYDNGSGEVLFHGWIFSNMMRNCSHAVTSHIHIDTEGGDIGGGSFHGGGGGFSGGGFGGGGGGAW